MTLGRKKVVDIELTHPLADITDLAGYTAIHALVRSHAAPVGYLELPVVNNVCTATAQRAAIIDRLGPELVKLQLYRLLVSPQNAPLSLAALADAQPPNHAGQLPSVTVAVCTRNRPDDLARCLVALNELDYPELDLLVIDNAPSDDATKQLVRERFPKVRYVRETRPGLDWARNRAIREARGDIIAYTDDDVIVDRGWVRALATTFAENPGVMAVTGLVAPYELETHAQQLFELYGGFGRGFERRWYAVNQPIGERAATFHAGAGKFGTGANMAYRCEVFERIGLFDPALDVGTVTNGGGDLEMFFRVIKAGFTLVYEPRAIVRHRHRREYEQLRTQLANNGVGFYSYLIRSAIAYPDERRALTRTALWWLWYWNIQRWLLSLARPLRMPRDLIAAELRGSFVGLRRYQKARRTAASIAGGENYLPALASPHAPADPRADAVAVREVDIARPLQPLNDVMAYPSVELFVFWNGRPLGSVPIANRYQPVGVTRLAEAITGWLSNPLLEALTGRSNELALPLAIEQIAAHHFLVAPQQLVAHQLPEPLSASIVVATFDRPDDLRTCLRSLVEQQTTRRLEIIVVDNHPTSGVTPPVVAQFPGVVLLDEPRQGLSYARNRGFAASTGDILVTTDDDVTAPPDWIEKLLAPFARADVMAVTGNTLPAELETQAQRMFERYGGLGRGYGRAEVGAEWFESFRRRGVPTWDLGATANAAFRARLLADPVIGMLDEALGAGTATGCSEDTYLFYKILKAGYTILYEPSAYLWHRHRSDAAALRRQIYNYSKGHVAYHLTTLLDDRDPRALAHLLGYMPYWHVRHLARQTLDTVRGKNEYPLSLTFTEIWGNLIGPLALLRSRRRVRRLGRSADYVPVEQRLAAQKDELFEHSVGR